MTLATITWVNIKATSQQIPCLVMGNLGVFGCGHFRQVIKKEVISWMEILMQNGHFVCPSTVLSAH